jgi:hypothetical protein
MPSWKKIILSGSDAALNSLTVIANVIASSFTGSLSGTASWANNAVSSSYSLTSSYALNAASSATVFPYQGDAVISGSLTITGSFSISGSSQYTYGVATTVSSSTNIISSIPTGSFRSAFYNYVAVSGSNARAGQITTVWYINTSSYSETTTTDIGSTAGLNLLTRINQGNIQLIANTAIAGWTIDASINLV